MKLQQQSTADEKQKTWTTVLCIQKQKRKDNNPLHANSRKQGQQFFANLRWIKDAVLCRCIAVDKNTIKNSNPLQLKPVSKGRSPLQMNSTRQGRSPLQMNSTRQGPQSFANEKHKSRTAVLRK